MTIQKINVRSNVSKWNTLSVLTEEDIEMSQLENSAIPIIVTTIGEEVTSQCNCNLPKKML